MLCYLGVETWEEILEYVQHGNDFYMLLQRTHFKMLKTMQSD